MHKLILIVYSVYTVHRSKSLELVFERSLLCLPRVHLYDQINHELSEISLICWL